MPGTNTGTQGSERRLQKLIQDQDTDPAVANQVGPFSDVPIEPGVDKQIAMTDYERRKLANDRKRNRQAYDLPEELVQAIARIMDWYRDSKDQRMPFPASRLVAYLITLGIQKLLEMPSDPISPMLERTDSPRFAYNLPDIKLPAVPKTSPWSGKK
jgi:hypothetical protein